jgi:hypothetical protein
MVAFHFRVDLADYTEGVFADFSDATVALPLIVRAVLERIGYFKRE